MSAARAANRPKIPHALARDAATIHCLSQFCAAQKIRHIGAIHRCR
jgi:hypothetical protein